ncbi:MAG: hypothetical protein JSS66_02990 [Armatimonadetes bacterium]|nr:hypothetical protein [Armatimonadota bacterium]
MLNLLAQSSSSSDAAAGLMAGGMMMFVFAGVVVLYVVMAIALMTIANKLGKNDKSWWAWIPILNLLLLAELGGQQVWMGLLCLIPYVGAVFAIYLWWKVCEARNKPGWMSLLMLIPCVGLFVPLYIAFTD